MGLRTSIILMAIAVISACIGLPVNSGRRPSNIEQQTVGPVKAFVIVHQIAISPRCTNCHAKGEQPMVLAGTEQKYHPMDMQRGFSRLGGACTSCHQNQNFATPHMPPGAENWRMPSAIKAYDAFVSPAELCQLWTGPTNAFEEGPQIGKQRTPQDLLVHVTSDSLVNWSFDPGPGRESARSGPGGHDYFVAYFKQWVDGGAPCPTK
jgi:hypothetical protein